MNPPGRETKSPTSQVRKPIPLFGLGFTAREVVLITVLVAAIGAALGYIFVASGFATFLATMSAVAALVAIILVALSLKLTRETVRPFLTISRLDIERDTSGDPLNLVATVSNTGPMPARNVVVHMNLFFLRTNEQVFSKSIELGLVFPRADNSNVTLKPKPEFWKSVRAGKVGVSIKMTYEWPHNSGETELTFHIKWSCAQLPVELAPGGMPLPSGIRETVEFMLESPQSYK